MRSWLRGKMAGDGRARAGAALVVALVTIAVGAIGLLQPDSLTAIRRSYFATPARLYAAGVVRVAMGGVLVLAAPRARWPVIVGAFGALMCLQGLSAMLMGPEHARAVLEWETLHTTLLRSGALVALLSGGILLCAVRDRPPHSPM